MQTLLAREAGEGGGVGVSSRCTVASWLGTRVGQSVLCARDWAMVGPSNGEVIEGQKHTSDPLKAYSIIQWH